MAEILTIRRLPKAVQSALRERARRAGRSMEAEARAILTDACLGTRSGDWAEGLQARARARTAGRPQTDSAEIIGEGRDAR
ncbi:MAG: Arc family DNA-binding protein [Geminicoccaceae bacterium]